MQGTRRRPAKDIEVSDVTCLGLKMVSLGYEVIKKNHIEFSAGRRI